MNGHEDRQSRGTEKKRRAKVRQWHIAVQRIDAKAYPAFATDRDHPFIGMEQSQRLREFIACCAQLWARACQEAARSGGKSDRVVA